MQVGQQQSRQYISNPLKSKSRILLKPLVQCTLNVNSHINMPQTQIPQESLLQLKQNLNKANDSIFQFTSNYHSIIKQEETTFLIKTCRNFDKKDQNKKIQSLSLQKSPTKGILKQKVTIKEKNNDLRLSDTNEISLLTTKRTKILNEMPSNSSKLSLNPLIVENNRYKKVSFSNQIDKKINNENFSFKPKRYVLADLDDIK